MKGKTKIIIAILASVPLIMVLGNSMLIPVLPMAQKSLGVSSKAQIGLLITLFSIPAGITIPFAGFISDRVGRKKVIVPALFIYGVGGLISGLSALFLSKAFMMVLVGRVVQGIGAAGTAPIAMALVSDIITSKERSKALGLIETGNGMGKVISPILGSLVGLLAWFAPFFVYTALTVPVALAVWFVVKEPKKKKQQSTTKYFKTLKNIFAQKALPLITSFLAGTIVLFILFGVLFFLSDFLESAYKIDGLKKGFLIAIPVLFMAVTSYLAGSYLQKKQKMMKLLVIAGLIIGTVPMALLAFFSKSIIMFFILISLIGVGTGMVLPALNTLITSSTSPEERGMVTALYGGVRFMGVALGPPIFGVLMNIGKPVMFITGAVISGITALLAFFFINEKKMLQKKPTNSNDKNGTGKEKSGKTVYESKKLPPGQPILTKDKSKETP